VDTGAAPFPSPQSAIPTQRASSRTLNSSEALTGWSILLPISAVQHYALQRRNHRIVALGAGHAAGRAAPGELWSLARAAVGRLGGGCQV